MEHKDELKRTLYFSICNFLVVLQGLEIAGIVHLFIENIDYFGGSALLYKPHFYVCVAIPVIISFVYTVRMCIIKKNKNAEDYNDGAKDILNVMIVVGLMILPTVITIIWTIVLMATTDMGIYG